MLDRSVDLVQCDSHNAVHWGHQRPDEVMCRPLHSKKVIVWAAMCKGQPLISPFFDDESESSVIINAERYIATALRPFWTALGRRHRISSEEEYLQQDGAAPHTARTSLEWLEEHFLGRHISLKTAVPWAPDSSTCPLWT